MSKKPIYESRYYQKEAIESATTELFISGRATVKMACGTGKTFVSMQIAKNVKPSTVIVVAPTIALVDQLFCEWISASPWESVSAMGVCSKKIGDSLDQDTLEMDFDDLSFPVSTSPIDIRSFIDRDNSSEDVKIILSTYDSLPAVALGMAENFSFDLGVFDEAHNMTGFQGKKRAFGLIDSNISIEKRLFLTATPKMFDYSGRDVSPSKKPSAIFTMDNKDQFGSICYSYSFAQAIKDKVIKDYDVVLSIVDKSSIGNIDNGLVKFHGRLISLDQAVNAIAIEKSMNKYGIDKAFSFHSRLVDAENLARIGNQICDDIEYGFIKGTMSSKDRKKVFRRMKKVKRMVATNSRCLVEGINFPEIGMVIFASGINGKVAIVQAVGRCLRIPENYSGEKAIIVIPIYVEDAKSMTDSDWGESLGKYNTVINVLGALKDEGDEMTALFSSKSSGRSLLNRGRAFANEHIGGNIVVDCASDDVDINTSHIRDVITNLCVQRLFPEWDAQYMRLRVYHELHGRWPDASCSNRDLYVWSNHQRALRRSGSLSRDKIEKLIKIDFPWHSRDVGFLNDCFDYQCFQSDYNYIPDERPENHFYTDLFEKNQEQRLIKWRIRMKKIQMEGKLSDFRILKLKEIGIDLGDTMQDFLRFIDTAMDLISTIRREPSIRARSVKEKRVALRLAELNAMNTRGELPDERIAFLKSLGVGRWRTMSELRATGAASWFSRMEGTVLPYLESTGRTPRIDANCKDVRAEARWYNKQMDAYVAGKLTMEQERFIVENNIFPVQPDDHAFMDAVAIASKKHPDIKKHIRLYLRNVKVMRDAGTLQKKTLDQFIGAVDIKLK